MSLKHEGISVTIGENEYVIPALSLGQIKKLLPKIEKMQANPTSIESFNAVSEIIHAALTRNYPDITIEMIDDMIDMSNFMIIFNAVLSVSGFMQGEQKAGNVS